MKKIILVTMFAFTLGFYTNRIFINSQNEEANENLNIAHCTDLNTAKRNLISMSKNEYIEYLNIKDLKQKYEKADELLGKIMLLFLADIGFKMQQSDIVSQPIAPNIDVVSEESTKTKVDTLEEIKLVNSSNIVTLGLEGKSSVIKILHVEKQIRDVLDHAIIDNAKVEFAKGKTPTKTQIKLLEGRYNGNVRFFDTKRESLNIVWDLMPDTSKPGLSGTFNLSIGKSDSISNGTLDNILSLSEDRDGFLLNACGGSCYLQLYYNSPADKFYGNYYESNIGSDAKVERLGLIELKK